MIDIYIFSKNRAFQLDMLLRSMKKYCKIDHKITVQYTADEPYRKAYYILAGENKEVDFIRETDFRQTLIITLDKLKNENILFLVDDDIFINDLTEKELAGLMAVYKSDNRIHGLSLRLNPAVNYCYPAKKEMSIPVFIKKTDGYIIWNWTFCDYSTCWGYPMPIDCHIYNRGKILEIAAGKLYKNVNSLEASLNRCRDKTKPLMMSAAETKIYNIQHNFVKDDGDNKAIRLNERFLAGERPELPISLVTNINACHGYIAL